MDECTCPRIDGYRIPRPSCPVHHEHEWKRHQNVTTKGYVMPPYEACACGAARQVDQ